MRTSTETLIYAVDDDPDEHHLLQTIFTFHLANCTLRCFSDGTELLTQLTHRLDGRLPDLILLDWHMPLLGGHQVLQLLRDDDQWCSIPVVVRSSTQAEAAVKSCYELGARAFLIKSHSYQQCVDSVAALRHAWAGTGLSLN